MLWEPYPSYYNGLFSPLLVLRDFATRQINIGVIRTVRDFLPFYVTLSFLCNIICYLISVFVLSLVTLSGATTLSNYQEIFCFGNCTKSDSSLFYHPCPWEYPLYYCNWQVRMKIVINNPSHTQNDLLKQINYSIKIMWLITKFCLTCRPE